MTRRFSTRGSAYAAIRSNPAGVIAHNKAQDRKREIASKMESKSYTNIRCGHCGKFGHHHSKHSKGGISPNFRRLVNEAREELSSKKLPKGFKDEQDYHDYKFRHVNADER